MTKYDFTKKVIQDLRAKGLLNENAIKNYVAKPNLKKGDVVKIKNKAKGESEYVRGYNGNGTVVTDNPNDYGLLKIKIHREEGFEDFGDYSYHKSEELYKKKA